MDTAAGRARFYQRRLVAVGFGATVAIGALASLTKHVAQTDRVFARIKGTSGATSEQMQKVRSTANQIGAEMPVDMRQAANAFEQLSYAGFSVKESINSANDVVQIAIAGNMKMGEAAKTTSRALRAYKLEANEISQVTNAMAGAFTNSAFNMEELNKSLEYVMPVASSANQSITSTTAALGTLADTGLAGSKAGTSLQRFFINITKQSGNTKEAMDRLGVSLDDFTSKTGGFQRMYKMIGTLKNRLQGVSDIERMEILQKMFGARGYRAVSKLIDNYDTFVQKIGDNTRAQLNDTMRTLEDMSDKELEIANQTFDFKITGDMKPRELVSNLNSAADNLSQSDLAAKINKAFSGIGQQSAQIFASDLKGGASVDELTKSITSMTTASDIAEEQMKSLWGQIEYLMGSLDSLAMKMVSGASPALNAFFTAAKALVDVLNGMPRVVRGLGLGLAGLAGLLTYLSGQYAILYAKEMMELETMKKLVDENFVASKSYWLLNKAHGMYVAAKNKIIGILPTEIALKKANSMWTSLVATKNKLLAGAKKALTVESLKSAAATSSDTASKIAESSAVATLRNRIAQSTVAQKANTVAKYAGAAASYVAAGAVWALNAAWSAFMTLTPGGWIVKVVVAIGVLAAAIYGLLQFDVSGWVSGIMEWFDKLKQTLSDLWWYVEATYAAFAYMGELAIGGTLDILGGMFDWVAQQIENFITWFMKIPVLGDTVKIILDALSGSSKNAGDNIGFLGMVLNAVHERFKNLMMILNSVIKSVNLFIDTIVAGIDAIAAVINPIIGTIATLIRDGFGALEAVLSAVMSAIRPVVNIIGAVLTPVIKAVSFAIDLLVDNLDLIALGLLAIFGPLSWTAVAITTLLTRFDDFVGGVQAVAGALSGAFGGIIATGQWVIDVFVSLFDNIGKAIGGLISIVEATGNAIATVASLIYDSSIGAVVNIIAGAFAVLGDAVDSVVSMFSSAEKAAGSTIGIFGKVANVVGSVLNPVMSALKAIGEAIVPMLVILGSTIAAIAGGPVTLAVGAFTALVAGAKILGDILGWLAGVFEWVASGIDSVTGALGGGLSGIGSKLASALSEIPGVLSAAVSLGVDAVWSFIQGIASTITDVGGTISGLLSSALDVSVNIFSTGYNIGVQLLHGIVSGIVTAPGMVIEAVQSLVSGLATVAEPIVGAVESVVGPISQVIDYVVNDMPVVSTIIQFVVDTFLEFYDSIAGLVTAIGNLAGVIVSIVAKLGVIAGELGVLSIVSYLAYVFTVWKGVIDVVVDALGVLYQILKPIIDPIIAVAQAIASVLIPVLKTIWSVIKPLVFVVGALAAAFLLITSSGVIGTIVGGFILLVGAMKVLTAVFNVLTDVINGVAGVLMNFDSVLDNVISTLFDTIVMALTQPEKFVQAAVQMGVSFVTGLINSITNLLSNIGAILGSLFGEGKQAGSDAAQAGQSLGEMLVSGIVGGILSVPGMIVDGISGIIGGVTSMLGSIPGIASLGVDLIKSIVGGILSVPGIVIGAVQDLMGFVGSAISGGFDILGDIGGSIAGGIVDSLKGIISLVSGIGSLISGALGPIAGFIDGIAYGFQMLAKDLSALASHAANADGPLSLLAYPLMALSGLAKLVGESIDLLGESISWLSSMLGGDFDWMSLIPDLSIFDPVIEAVQGTISFFEDIGSKIVDYTISGLKGLGSIVFQYLKWQFQPLINIGSAIAGFLIDGIQSSISAVVSFFEGIGSYIIGGLIQGFNSAIGVLQGFVVGPIMGALGVAGDVAGKAADVGRNIIEQIASGIISVPGILIGAFQNLMSGAFNYLMSLIPTINFDPLINAFSTLVGWGEQLYNVISGLLMDGLQVIMAPIQMIGQAGQYLGNVFAQAANVFSELPGPLRHLAGPLQFVSDIFNTVAGAKNIPETIAEGIRKAPSVIKNALVGLFKKLIPFMPSSDADKGPLSNLTGMGAGLVKAIASGILSAPGKLLGAVTGMLGGLAGSAMSAAKNLGGQIAGGIKDGIQGAKDMIKGGIDTAVGAAQGAANTAVNVATGAGDKAANMAGKVGDAAGGLWNGAKNLAGNAVGGVKNAMGNVKGAVGGVAEGMGTARQGSAVRSAIANTLQAPMQIPGGGPQAVAGGPTDNSKRVSKKNETNVIFQGEVHDARTVDKKIRDGVQEGKNDQKNDMIDDLDAGSDNR